MSSDGELSDEEREELIQKCDRLKAKIVAEGESAETRVRLANAHLRLGEREETMMCLQVALSQRPGTPAILSKLRQICTEEEFAKLEVPEEIEPFWHDIVGLFKYPVSGSGIYLLIGGTVFVAVLEFIARLPTIFFYGSIILSIFLAGYLCAYFISVMRSSARGGTSPPDWPDITDMVSNVFRSLLIVSFPATVSFFPALVYWFYSVFFHGHVSILIGSVAVGALYYPMALVASVMTGAPMNSANIVGIVSSIVKVRREYFFAELVLAFLACVSFVAYFIVTVVTGALAGAIIAGFALRFTYLYFLMIYAHILGLLYRQSESRIN